MSTSIEDVKVSVIMPVYNVEKYVAACIQSVLLQSYQNFELIIVNDCATDRSLQICETFTDQRIRIINHENNRGLAGARNTGIANARGLYLAFIDSDDMWHPEKLSMHVQHLKNNPHVGLSFSRSEFMEADGRRTGYYQMPKLKHIEASDILCRNPVGNGSAPVIRRCVLQQISYMDDYFGKQETFYFDARLRRSEDIECWLRIALVTNWRVEGLPQALTYYRLNEGGLSASLFAQYDSWQTVIERTHRYAPAFIDKWSNKARAYQLRYLARQAIRLRMGDMSVHFFNKALATDTHILVEEPGRTLATMGAAYLMRIVPRDLYIKVESYASRFVSYIHRITIKRDLQMPRV